MKRPLAIAFLLAVLWVPTHAEDINATLLSGLIQTDGKGLYDQVLKLLNFSYEALPPARAELYMTANETCMFPVDRRFMKSKADLIESDPITVVSIFIYSINGGFETAADLKGKNVGLRHGLNYGPKIELMQKTLSVDFAPTLESNLKKLQLGRVAAVIEFDLDVREFEKINQDVMLKISKLPLDSHKDAITCFNTPKNRQLIDRFNIALKHHRMEIDQIVNYKLTQR